MSKVKKDTIEAKGFAIQIYTEDFKNDYISLTDIAKYKNTQAINIINILLMSILAKPDSNMKLFIISPIVKSPFTYRLSHFK